ncbi:hypothetical protein A9P82_08965 [Arachidicoccus ginsenosidimutans]|uniref:type IX secretion system protein PorG n=1 Tax=Arachidicoccus sp. BS20 TaxID=1850526 RepID=UPI0007F084B9|nr:DUF6089 family protein [Arachidicoccus sp. BS20]ANI89414.1 hypothetical protein A9P82_08965 [Arachidicoccus sp. BS20]
MIYKKYCLLLLGIFSVCNLLQAQYQSYQAKGELGIGVGSSTYFGDLNPSGKVTPIHYSAGAFYQKYFSNYIGVRLSANYIHLHASDADSKNIAYKTRNLNFSNNMLEMSLTGSFNFFNYAPGFSGHNFTPYVSLGIGTVYSNPYTFDDEGKKVYLRSLGTEGQKSTTSHDGKKYGPFAMVFPLSVGVRQALSQRINLFAEVGYRFTTTDYLDDASTTYAGASAFDAANYKGSPTQASIAKQLQDRSQNQSLGIKGWQRGNSAVKDSYLLMQIGISYNFSNCNCPGVF